MHASEERIEDLGLVPRTLRRVVQAEEVDFSSREGVFVRYAGRI